MRIHAPEVTTRRRLRAGMTLIEVMIAVVICAGALLSLGSYVGKFTRGVSDAQVRAAAEQLATERVEQARWQGTYPAVDSMARTEAAITGFPSFQRQTWVQRVGGADTDTLDYRIVTVRVTNPVLRTPVRKTTIIAAF